MTFWAATLGLLLAVQVPDLRFCSTAFKKPGPRNLRQTVQWTLLMTFWAATLGLLLAVQVPDLRRSRCQRRQRRRLGRNELNASRRGGVGGYRKGPWHQSYSPNGWKPGGWQHGFGGHALRTCLQ